MKSAKIQWWKHIRKSNHLRCTVENLLAEIRGTDEPTKRKDKPRCKHKCKHVWKCLRDRWHNKGDGKGKYRVYKCKICYKVSKRY